MNKHYNIFSSLNQCYLPSEGSELKGFSIKYSNRSNSEATGDFSKIQGTFQQFPLKEPLFTIYNLIGKNS